MKLNVGLVSFGYPNFRVDIAKEKLLKTIDILSKEDINLIYHNEVIIDTNETDNFIENLKENKIDMLIIQNGTFSDGNHIIKITEKLSEIPILLWAFPEPKAGEFNYIALNSMCAFNMYTSFLYKLKVPFNYVFGNVEDKEALIKVKNNIEALKVKKKLGNSKFCIIGGRAPGFYLSNIDEVRFRKEIGPEIVYYSLAQLLEDARNLEDEVVKAEINKIKAEASQISTTEEAIEKTARIYQAIKNYKEANHIDAFTIKCWPEMQGLYNFAVCGVLSKLNSEGIMVSCEGDIPGLTTMYIQNLLTDKSCFFADIVNINENGSVKLWHCGCAPYSLACSRDSIKYSEHPTIKNGIGMAVEFQMNRGRLVMCKLKEDEKRYKMFMVSGEGVEEDRYLIGNQADIRFDAGNENLLKTIVENGIEHHYSIIYEDIIDKMEILCKWMSVEPISCK